MKKKNNRSYGIRCREGEARYYCDYEYKLMLAKKLGYESVDDAMKGIYHKHRSATKVANLLGYASYKHVVDHLRRLRIRLRSRGGSVRNNTGIFRVDCHDGVRRTFVAATVSPTKKFSNMRCIHCHAVMSHIKSVTNARAVMMLKYHCCDDIPKNRHIGRNKVRMELDVKRA